MHPILVSYIVYNISYLREYRTPNSALFGCGWLSLTIISHNTAVVQRIKYKSIVNVVEISLFFPLVIKRVKKIRVHSGVSYPESYIEKLHYEPGFPYKKKCLLHCDLLRFNACLRTLKHFVCIVRKK